VYLNLKRFFIGNMGNPVITRLGKTQIWYKNWYTNLHFSKTLKIIHTFEKIINSYFNYGIFYTKNLFHHSFWYKTHTFNQKNNYIDVSSNRSINNELYFRKYYFSHKTLTIEHSYFIRLSTPEYFPLKLNVLSYNKWLVVSLQWFKPFKKTFKKHQFFLNKKHPILSYNSPSVLKNNKKRLILFSLFIKNNPTSLLLNKSKYIF
jgi:hypothetical protein